MNKSQNNNEQAYKLLIRVLKKVESWKEYEQILCDAFMSMCGLSKRLELVKDGENEMDEVNSTFSVGVLASFPGSVHSLAQKLSTDIESNWKIISQQLTSLNAIVVHEIQVCEDEAFKYFSSIPIGAIAIQGSGIPITVSECVLWISQINKMISAEYLRKRDLFTQFTTNQMNNWNESSSIWPASSSEGMIDFSLLNEIADRVVLVNKSFVF